MDERKTLFRRQVFQRHAASEEFGRTLAYQPLGLTPLTLFFVAFFLAILAFLYWGIIKDRVLVRGNLTPKSGVVKIFPTNPGRYSEILVKEGDAVNEGQIVARISTEKYNESGHETTYASLQLIKKQRDNFKLEIEAAKQRTELTMASRIDAIDGLKRQIDLQKKELEIAQKKLLFAEEDFSVYTSLYEKRMVGQELLTQKRSLYLSTEQEVKGLATDIERLTAEKKTHQHALRAEPVLLKEKLLSLSSSVDQIDQQMLQMEGNRIYALKAPTKGVVAALVGKVGNAADPRQPLLTVIPDNERLEAQLYVNQNAIGAVQQGQEVLLTYDAFPIETYGSYKGTVVTVSEELVDPREQLLPIAELKQPVYVVKVALKEQKVRGKELISLQSGMLLTADIVVQERTMLNRFFDPISRTRAKL